MVIYNHSFYESVLHCICPFRSNVSQGKRSSSGRTNNSSVHNMQQLLASETSQTSLETSQAGPIGDETLSTCSSDETISVEVSERQNIPSNTLHNTNQQRKLSNETKTAMLRDHRNKEMEEDLGVATVGASNDETESEMAFLFRGSSKNSEIVRRKPQSGVLPYKDSAQSDIDRKFPQLDDYHSDSSHRDFDIGDGFYSPDRQNIGIINEDTDRKNQALGTISFCKGDTAEKDGRRKKRRYLFGRRKSSFLVPFFNRRESVTMSFVKPSLSALHRKQKMEEERVRRKEEGLAQEEVEMEEEEEVGEEGVGGDTEEERGRFFYLWEKVKISLKEALANLKQFVW